MDSHVRKQILDTFLLTWGAAVSGIILQDYGGAAGLAVWVAIALTGAVIGILVWLLYRLLGARLADPATTRVATALAGALAGVATGAFVAILLQAPVAVLVALLSQGIGKGAGIVIGIVVWLVPELLLARSHRVPVGSWHALVALATLLPAFYGWAALFFRTGFGTQATHLVIAGAAIGALTGLFGPKRLDGSPRPRSFQE